MYFHLLRMNVVVSLSCLFRCQTLAFWSHLTLISLVFFFIFLSFGTFIFHSLVVVEQFHYVKSVCNDANKKLSCIHNSHCTWWMSSTFSGRPVFDLKIAVCSCVVAYVTSTLLAHLHGIDEYCFEWKCVSHHMSTITKEILQFREYVDL